MQLKTNIAHLSSIKKYMLDLIERGYNGNWVVWYSDDLMTTWPELDTPEDYEGSIADYMEDEDSQDDLQLMMRKIEFFLKSGWHSPKGHVGQLIFDLDKQTIEHHEQSPEVNSEDEWETVYRLADIP